MQIKLNYLKAAHVASSDEKTRYYLEGVHISVRDGHVEYVATDGHRLIALRHELSTDSACVWPAPGVIVPNALIERIKLGKRDDDTAEIAMDGNAIELRHNGTLYGDNAIDGTFPDWRRSVPGTLSGEVAQFNSNYLADFAKAAKIMGHNIAAPVVSHNGGSAALVNFLPGLDAGFGIIMPVRTNDALTAAPTWASLYQNKTQAA